MERGRWWLLAGILAVTQASLGLAAWARAREEHTTYVFTPLVDVVPGGVPLGAAEASALVGDVRHQVDARDMQSAYARLGSTMALDDLLRGVEGLDAAGHPLTGAAADHVRDVLTQAKADHADIVRVQAGILDAEAELAGQVAGVMAALPADAQARVQQKVGGAPR